ncbi:MAG: hypothetical protein AMXMBFR13_16690 [Phycisphaerae bacterium]
MLTETQALKQLEHRFHYAVGQIPGSIAIDVQPVTEAENLVRGRVYDVLGRAMAGEWLVDVWLSGSSTSKAPTDAPAEVRFGPARVGEIVESREAGHSLKVVTTPGGELEIPIQHGGKSVQVHAAIRSPVVSLPSPVGLRSVA